MKNMNPDLDIPGCLLSKTHIGKILAISTTFEIFSLFQWKRLNKYAIYAYTHGPVTGSALSPH